MRRRSEQAVPGLSEESDVGCGVDRVCAPRDRGEVTERAMLQ